jgi:hypothetical protein
MVYSDFWVARAVKYILGKNFGGPAQKWGRVGLGGGGARSNSLSLNLPQLGGKWDKRASRGSRLGSPAVAGRGEQANPSLPIKLPHPSLSNKLIY